MDRSIKKQLAPKDFTPMELNQSKGILDDHAVRKSERTKAFQLSDGTEGAGKILTSDANGNGSWQAAGAGEAFPIGFVFIAVVNTNPNTLLGYGTWSAFAAGRVLVGLDATDPDFDTVEETGGTKAIDGHYHYLGTVDGDYPAGIPTSSTSAGTPAGTIDGHTTYVPKDGSIAQPARPFVSPVNHTFTGNALPNHGHVIADKHTDLAGGHSLVQPSIVVYMWKRTA